METRPHFIGIGAAKSGTTTLHDILSAHPDLYLPQEKEVSFFCTRSRFEKGVPYYYNCFRAAGRRRCGEITPQYLYDPDVPSRVYDVLGADVKLIVMLRNPADRAFSHFQHVRLRGYESLSFNEAIQQEPHRIQCNEQDKNRYSYIDRGRYYRQLKPWFDVFGRDNFFFVIFETDFLSQRARTLDLLQSFLDVPFYNLPEKTHSNRSGHARFLALNKMLYQTSQRFRPLYRAIVPSPAVRRRVLGTVTSMGRRPPEKLDPALRAQLIHDIYWDDICALENLLECDLSVWKTATGRA